VGWFEALTGVTPRYGSAHHGLGTHNALVSLGNGVYIELLAVDPQQVGPEDKRPPYIGADTAIGSTPAIVAYGPIGSLSRSQSNSTSSVLSEQWFRFCVRVEPSGMLSEWREGVKALCGIDFGGASAYEQD